MSGAGAVSPPRIARFGLVTADAERLARFYAAALGFAPVTGGAGARAIRLGLGRQELALAVPASPGRPYPAGIGGDDPRFQHLAIVVSDMRAAYARLAAETGWTPITTAGPQHLPASSGGVTAFKFRDPEGHPLELLEFPRGAVPRRWQGNESAGPSLGIDHSAITVAETARSLGFYADLLGFSIGARSLNRGIGQERLDGVPGAIVAVTALDLPAAPPHLELLCYRRPAPRPAAPLAGNDVAATRVVLAVDDLPVLLRRLEAAAVEFISRPEAQLDRARPAALLRDPDGHALCLVDG